MRESNNPEDLVKFANSVFRTRLKIARRFNNRMRPKEGLEGFNTEELSDLSEDLILKGVFAKIRAAQKYLNDGKQDYAEAKINSVLEILETAFYQSGLNVSSQSIFDLSDIIVETKNLAKNIDDKEILNRLDDIDQELCSEVRFRFDGTIWRSKELGENFEILRVEDWAYGMPQHIWVAIIQWEDGTFWDENMVAVQNREEYQWIGMKDHRARDRILNCEHDFNDEGKCKKCNLTTRSVSYLGGNYFIQCDECTKWSQDDKIEMIEEDYFVCEDCR